VRLSSARAARSRRRRLRKVRAIGQAHKFTITEHFHKRSLSFVIKMLSTSWMSFWGEDTIAAAVLCALRKISLCSRVAVGARGRKLGEPRPSLARQPRPRLLTLPVCVCSPAGLVWALVAG
jgi:hypothetical protein